MMDVNALLLRLDRLLADTRPNAITDCLDRKEGFGVSLNRLRCMQRVSKSGEIEELEAVIFSELLKPTTADAPPKKKRKAQSVKSLCPCCFDEEGQKAVLNPRQTMWHFMHAKNPALEQDKWKKKFRRRFRMDCAQCLHALGLVSADERFARWTGRFRGNARDASGRKASPIELLLLGLIQHLGRGLAFDELEECTAMHEETHRQFFHIFVEFGAAVLHPLHVVMPTTADNFKTFVAPEKRVCPQSWRRKRVRTKPCRTLVLQAILNIPCPRIRQDH